MQLFSLAQIRQRHFAFAAYLPQLGKLKIGLLSKLIFLLIPKNKEWLYKM